MTWFDNFLLGINRFFLDGVETTRRPGINLKGSNITVTDNPSLDALDLEFDYIDNPSFTTSSVSDYLEIGDVVATSGDLRTATSFQAYTLSPNGLSSDRWLNIGSNVVFGFAENPDGISNSGTILQGATYVQMTVGGVGYCRVDSSGNFRPLTDEGANFGSTSARWGNGYFGTSIFVGDDPATSGVICVDNTGQIASRNAGDNDNIELIRANSSDAVVVGDPAAAASVYLTALSSIRGYVNGTNVLHVSSDQLRSGSDSTHSLGTEAVRWSEAHVVDLFANTLASDGTLAITAELLAGTSIDVITAGGTSATVLGDADVSTQITGAGITFDVSGTDEWYLGTGILRPITDGGADVGSTSYRVDNYYGITGSIQTSDERLKTEIESITDDVLDAWAEVEWVSYKFVDSVEEKGSDVARIHVGAIAQRVVEAFESKGLDATRYGLLCYDEWEEELGPDEAAVEAAGAKASLARNELRKARSIVAHIEELATDVEDAATELEAAELNQNVTDLKVQELETLRAPLIASEQDDAKSASEKLTSTIAKLVASAAKAVEKAQARNWKAVAALDAAQAVEKTVPKLEKDHAKAIEAFEEAKADRSVVIKEAGNRYGLRYEECLVMEAALMRRTRNRLEERLSEIESKK